MRPTTTTLTFDVYTEANDVIMNDVFIVIRLHYELFAELIVYNVVHIALLDNTIAVLNMHTVLVEYTGQCV